MPSAIPGREDADHTPPNGLDLIDSTRHERDDTTRYLCAAAHLDADYANKAIKEFLVEPTRPVTPTPGVDVGTVLAESIAARTRRKLVDSALIVLAVALVIVAPMNLLLAWVVLAVAVAIPRYLRRTGKSVSSKRGPLLIVTVISVVAVIAVFFGDEISKMVDDLSDSAVAEQYDDYADTSFDVGGIMIIVFLGLALAALLADRVVVWRLLTRRFHRGAGSRRVPSPGLESRQVFQFSPNRFLTQLRERYLGPRTLSAPEDDPGPGKPAPIVVHRGYNPFVGGGRLHRPWSIAIPLLKNPTVDKAIPLNTATLYAGIVDEATKLRSSTDLTPGGRLRTLAVDELIVVSAAELIDHLGDPVSTWFLAGTGTAPYDQLSPKRTVAVRDQPVEWARYYRCFRVETWDRDLVLAVYLHVAMDDSMLYIEWTPSVLGPIKEEFQGIDTESRSVWRPIRQAIADLAMLPASIPRRLGHTFTFLRPLRDDRGVIDSDKYGALHSLRELVADTNMHSYFQLADRDRYLKMLESRVVLAVSKLLTDAGYLTASFDAQAATIIQNNVHIGGSVTGTVVAGTGNTVATPKP
ncbi:MAG: hypothetical protein M3548_24040 [Actinomycetota bacterium]|nr:hypothetical protein [Actinomycetota bacterium]